MTTTKSASGKLNVFISYSRDDIVFADQLIAALALSDCTTTIDRQGIFGGEDWKRRLGNLIRDADTVVFVLSPSSARSPICAWEAEEAVRMGKRIIPVLCRPLDDVKPSHHLTELNYIYFYSDPKVPGSGFGTGQVQLVAALDTDLEWLRENTRLLQRATEWQASLKPSSRLLFGESVVEAVHWITNKPRKAPEPTALQFEYIRASEENEAQRLNVESRHRAEIAALETARIRAGNEHDAERRMSAARVRRMGMLMTFGFIVATLFATLAGSLGFIIVQKKREIEGQRVLVLKQQADESAGNTAFSDEEGKVGGGDGSGANTLDIGWTRVAPSDDTLNKKQHETE